MLSIKPVIAVKDGSVDEAGKVRTRSKALRFIVDRVPEHGVERVAVLHACQTWTRSSSSSSGARNLDVVVGQIGPVIGVHTGPRAIGIGWIDEG